MISDPNLDKHYRALAALEPPDAARRALAALQPSDAARRALAALQPSDTAQRVLAFLMKSAAHVVQEQQRQADAMRLEIASWCRQSRAPFSAQTEDIKVVWSTPPPDPNFGFRTNRWEDGA